MRWVVMLFLLFALLGSRQVEAIPLRNGRLPWQEAVVGTVRSVDVQARTLEVLTGVGMAVRVIRVQVERGVPVRRGATGARLEDLEPGQVVRVVYRTTVEGKVASSVEVLSRQGGAP